MARTTTTLQLRLPASMSDQLHAEADRLTEALYEATGSDGRVSVAQVIRIAITDYFEMEHA
jgi:hypothetical protein